MMRTVQKIIPSWMIKIMRSKPSWQTPFVGGWSDNAVEPIYGVACGNKLHELHVTDSGLGSIVSTPNNKVATWGALRNYRCPPSIMSYSSRSYPQDEGWTVKGNTQTVRLSSLSVHRLTQIFTPDTSPPNSEKAWSDRLSHLNVNIPWPKIWASVGTFLTTPTDEKTWFKLIHRALMLNGKQKTDNTLLVETIKIRSDHKSPCVTT
eukprot:3551188-Pleurochrysis_carterae.AAC.1